MMKGLQEAFPKSIGLLPFDGGVTGNMRLVKELLKWQSKTELKTEILHRIKEVGSALYWVGLLDIVLREVVTTQFMQVASWLGLIPGVDGQILQSQDGNSPVVTLFMLATAAILSTNPVNPTPFYTMSKQVEAADLLYKANLNTGSVLEYALAFTSAALDKYITKWSAAPNTGFVDITTSKDFYCIFSSLQIEYLEDSMQVPQTTMKQNVGRFYCMGWLHNNLLTWSELFDFSYQVLNIAEVDGAATGPPNKSPHFSQGWEVLLEAMKKARHLNNHVFSMLKAWCPLEDKQACAIKHVPASMYRIKFENTVSAFETLPQKCSSHHSDSDSRTSCY